MSSSVFTGGFRLVRNSTSLRLVIMSEIIGAEYDSGDIDSMNEHYLRSESSSPAKYSKSFTMVTLIIDFTRAQPWPVVHLVFFPNMPRNQDSNG